VPVGTWTLTNAGRKIAAVLKVCSQLLAGYRSLPGARVVRVLERLAETIGLPQVLVSDNGPEFAGRTLDVWAYRRGIELRFIRPGKPIENAYVESFNGKFRDECLNEHWFLSVAEAQQIIEAWRVDYNTVRPHRSLGQQTPAAYAAAACAGPAAGWGACSAAALGTPEQRTKSEGLSLSV
jgi:transposase InsO family protein